MNTNKKNSLTNFAQKTIIAAMIIATGSAYANNQHTLNIVASFNPSIPKGSFGVMCGSILAASGSLPSAMDFKLDFIQASTTNPNNYKIESTQLGCKYNNLTSNKKAILQLKESATVLGQTDLENLSLMNGTNNFDIKLEVLNSSGTVIPINPADKDFTLGENLAAADGTFSLKATGVSEAHATSLVNGDYKKSLTLIYSER